MLLFVFFPSVSIFNFYTNITCQNFFVCNTANQLTVVKYITMESSQIIQILGYFADILIYSLIL